jgi:hypothetical protein
MSTAPPSTSKTRKGKTMANTYAQAKRDIEEAERHNKGFLLFSDDNGSFWIRSTGLTAETIASFFIEVMNENTQVRDLVSELLGQGTKERAAKSGLII